MQNAEPTLLVSVVHRENCTFGSGFFRIELRDGGVRFCQNPEEVEHVHALLGADQVIRVARDGYCLDGYHVGDANTPDVVDGETWLGMPKQDAMALVGLDTDQDYARVYTAVESAVSRRNNRQSQTGVHASIVIKKKGARVTDV